ncbi:hypothetical protein RirG_098890 [Rhizophagus irregularis DAOM 197198w]|uniref:Uncharacterized protein n=1 Tax=Rhizophagus irregularis (strain DAOM 197198w) TaxID=1432141 RepID=A0A015MQX1_RHIIW|nr:hypothetical protein RirG_098890 [Rhizophagus irregularis DAOM 197198w]
MLNRITIYYCYYYYRKQTDVFLGVLWCRYCGETKANLICVGCVGDLLLFSSCDRKWPRTRASTFQSFQCKQSDVLWIRTCGGKSVGTWNRLEKNIKSRFLLYPRICVIKVRYDIAPDTENSTYEAEAENSRMCN